MRPYEVMVIFDPGTEPPAIQAVLDRVAETVKTAGGTPGQVDRWGRRTLAYEVNHRREGYYVLLDLSAESDTVAELDRLLHLADEVMRHKVVRLPERVAGRPRLPAPPEAKPERRAPRRTRPEGRGPADETRAESPAEAAAPEAPAEVAPPGEVSAPESTTPEAGAPEASAPESTVSPGADGSVEVPAEGAPAPAEAEASAEPAAGND